MNKLSTDTGIPIIQGFLNQVKKSVNSNSAVVNIEYFELAIEEKKFERWNCAYLQNETQTEGLLYEITTEKVFYVQSELVEGTVSKYVPELYSFDFKAVNYIPQRIIDKMRLVIQTKQDERLVSEDFGTKFSLTKPKSTNS